MIYTTKFGNIENVIEKDPIDTLSIHNTILTKVLNNIKGNDHLYYIDKGVVYGNNPRIGYDKERDK